MHYRRSQTCTWGKVKYVDRTTTLSGLNEAFWYKSKSFEHEREVRAVLHRHGVEDSGVLIALDLARVIREVRLSPFCPVWFEELVKDVSEKYGYTFDIRRSSLEDSPFYHEIAPPIRPPSQINPNAARHRDPNKFHFYAG